MGDCAGAEDESWAKFAQLIPGLAARLEEDVCGPPEDDEIRDEDGP